MFSATRCGVMTGKVIPDPYWSNVVLLLHMDGANTSTTFVDSSASAKTITSNNGAQLSTSVSKFGSASGLFDGTNDYLSVATSSDFNFGTGDFTVEGFFYRSASSGSHCLFELGSYSSPGFEFWIYNNAYISVYSSGHIIDAAATIATNTWYHVAISRSSGVLKLFLNGAELGSAAWSASVSNNGGTVFVGRSSAGEYFNGRLDEFRVTKGVGRYTANFTPPAAAFPNG